MLGHRRKCYRGRVLLLRDERRGRRTNTTAAAVHRTQSTGHNLPAQRRRHLLLQLAKSCEEGARETSNQIPSPLIIISSTSLHLPMLLFDGVGPPLPAGVDDDNPSPVIGVVGVPWLFTRPWLLLLLLPRCAPKSPPPPTTDPPPPLTALIGVDVEFRSNLGYRTAVGFTGCCRFCCCPHHHHHQTDKRPGQPETTRQQQRRK